MFWLRQSGIHRRVSREPPLRWGDELQTPCVKKGELIGEMRQRWMFQTHCRCTVVGWVTGAIGMLRFWYFKVRCLIRLLAGEKNGTLTKEGIFWCFCVQFGTYLTDSEGQIYPRGISDLLNCYGCWLHFWTAFSSTQTTFRNLKGQRLVEFVLGYVTIKSSRLQIHPCAILGSVPSFHILTVKFSKEHTLHRRLGCLLLFVSRPPPH